MSNSSGIALIHVRKLGHKIEEIRLRALDNIISKYDLGIKCDCDAVKKELIFWLFNWFGFETVPQPEKVLGLLQQLITTEGPSYLNAFGRARYQNELQELRKKLDPSWHEQLDQLEEVMLNSHSHSSTANDGQYRERSRYACSNHSTIDVNASQSLFILPATLDNTIPFDQTLEYLDGTPISKSIEGGMKWLVMPWQPLAPSDKGVLAAVEEALSNSLDMSLILHTCQFITNVMMQDFPAEVFLQRPAIVTILHNLLETSNNSGEANMGSVVATVLKTLHKLTRSLRLRIYYYCEPCIANKRQKLLAEKLSTYSSSEARDSPDGGLPEANYQVYQSTDTSERSHSGTANIDDPVLQDQQMLIPIYCSDTLKHVLSLLTMPINSAFPLRNIKYITDLVHELVQLLIVSIMPNIWLSNDATAVKTNEKMKTLFHIIGEVIEYFASYRSVDHFRITYLYIVSVTGKLLSSIVPLEIADFILPRSLKTLLTATLMDAPIFLLYPQLHSVLQDYARQFRGTDETAWVQIFDETKTIIKSIQAAIGVIKDPLDITKDPSEALKKLYTAKLTLTYHKNLSVVRKTIQFLQSIHRISLSDEDRALATKLILHLLANGNIDIKRATYVECRSLVKNVLGVEYNRDKLSSENLEFLISTSVLAEIIQYGVTDTTDAEIREMSEEILIYILKGQIQLAETGWLKCLEAIIPALPLLQCYASSSTPLGQCLTKMFDPDISTDIKIPYIELLRGNLRFLFSPNHDIREEALCRLIWLLEKEEDSYQKLPRLSSLHDLPLNSLCIFERQTSFKKLDGSYQKSNLLSVLEMLNTANIDPKMRKSALVQTSVMLSDSSLHKLFISENGLSLVLDIFGKALVEKDNTNYSDSVIPIISILKQLASVDSTVRHDMSMQSSVYCNITRSLFLFPNNEAVRMEGSQLLCLLLYNQYIMRSGEKCGERYGQFSISLPYIIVKRMKLPFACNAHWKVSIHRRSDISILHSTNHAALVFIRQYWMWEWHGQNILWKEYANSYDPELSDKLTVQESEFLSFRYSFPPCYCQQQLFNVQNSTTHENVSCAVDYLTMYTKLYKMHPTLETNDMNLLPWEQTFERFLLSHPTSKEDCDLFVDVVNFLQLYVKVLKDCSILWISKILKNITKSLSELFKNLEVNNQDVHQSILKLARTCSAIEKDDITSGNQKTWIQFIDLVVSTLCFGDQQHFYNLVYLDWLLSCLIYLIGRCLWSNYKSLLTSLGTTLIELIISFHGAGTVSFMGLSITRNSIICLNHVLYQMQHNFNETLPVFWYDEGRPLNWLPTLWENRDPLVRAAALQLLAGLTNNHHTANQLLNTIALAPSELCQCLLQCITSQEESCIVREQGCIAFSNLVKSCSSAAFQYVDSLKPDALLIYVEQSNVYSEINSMCSNIYMLTSLDCDLHDAEEYWNKKGLSIHSRGSECASAVPRIISCFYNCHGELQHFSGQGSDITDSDNYPQLIATPSLITAVCNVLNNLIVVGQCEVVRQVYEHSVDKYLLACLREVPKDLITEGDVVHYCDILEMYISICSVLTNTIAHGNQYATMVNFSPDLLYLLFSLLNHERYDTHKAQVLETRNRLWTEVFSFITVLSLTDGQHFEQIQAALEICKPETVFFSICIATKGTGSDLRMSAISCLAFLLAQEIQKEVSGTKIAPQCKIDTVGEELCEVLLHLFNAHNCTRSKKNRKRADDKDLIIGALTNLLCVSRKAKQMALRQNFPATALMMLKDLYGQLNLQPFELYRSQTNLEKKGHPLLHDIDSILILLMNFVYRNTHVKEALIHGGLADILHKLWAWLALNNKASTDALKLLATYTVKCPGAAQSLTLTTTLPGTGIRKTPNTLALIHVLIQLVCKEIDKAGHGFENHKLHFAFQILRNAVHVHECRVSISKSNLLQFFTKIHPITTRRAKPWRAVELYCLEFLMDFTFYEEGQLCVPKADDALDVLLHLGKCSSTSIRILAISILRNLAFNLTNRPRLLGSVDFMNLLHDICKGGSLVELKVATSMLWSLVTNNQKGKLIARSAGFPQSIQEALRRLALLAMNDKSEEPELTKMLQCIFQILSPS